MKKYMKKYKKETIVILVLVVILLVLVCSRYIFKLTKNKDENLNEIQKDLNSTIENMDNDIFSSYKKFVLKGGEVIKGRKIITKEEKYQILIGNNQKELENNYFDVWLKLENETAYVYINKLFKNFRGELVEKEYIKEIVNYIDIAFKISLNEEEKEELFKNIYVYYLELRKLNVSEDLEKNDYLSSNKVNFKFEYEDDMVKVILKKR